MLRSSILLLVFLFVLRLLILGLLSFDRRRWQINRRSLDRYYIALCCSQRNKITVGDISSFVHLNQSDICGLTLRVGFNRNAKNPVYGTQSINFQRPLQLSYFTKCGGEIVSRWFFCDAPEETEGYPANSKCGP